MIQAKRRALALAIPALALAALSLAQACGGSSKRPPDLKVISHTPGDMRTDPAEAIQIHFDKPVVAEEQIGAALAEPPVAIAPAVAIKAQWADRQTLVLAPAATLASSTRYRVSLTGALAGRTGDFQFAFVNHPLEVDGVWGMAPERLPPRPHLRLHFNQSVRGGDVARHCSLVDGAAKSGATTALRAAHADLLGDVVEVEPVAALAQGRDYQLVCREALTGAGGAEPMAEAFTQELHTYPTFSVASFGPDGSDVPADDVEISIQFANPVDLEALRKQLSSKPAIRGLDRGSLDGDGTRYTAVVNLEVQTSYQLRIGKAMTDVFGQGLAQAPSHSFKTGNARPRVQLETGIFALEPGAGGYPVWTRSVGKVALECAPVPRASVVKLLTSEMDYDPWYDASKPNQVDWKKLGLERRKVDLAISDAKNNWHLERVKLAETCGRAGEGGGGLFLADFSSPEIVPDPDRLWAYRPHRRVLANVTDLGVLLKAGSSSGLVWVTSMSTGKPVAGASVQVYSPRGKLVWSGTSDERGLAILPGTTRLLGQPGPGDREALEGGEGEGEEMDSYRAQRLIALVEKGGDVAAVDGNWANGIQVWNFGVEEDRKSGATRIRGLIQSDRGIYRPGETVHFKGLVREIAMGRAPAVPAGAPVAVVVTDSRGGEIFRKKLPLTRFGGFSFDLPLDGEAGTGDYTVLAALKGQSFRETFQVEEFRKVSFEVNVGSPVRHGMLGDKLSFEVGADFLFGAPVAGARVTWDVQRRAHSLDFPGYPEYGFADYAARGNYFWWGEEGGESAPTSFVSDGEGKTDAHGKLHFSVRDPQSKFDGPQDYLAHAVVTDESDQSVGKQVVVTAHPSQFYVGLHTQEFVQAVDMPFAVNTIAVRPDGQRVATGAKLSLVRESYECSYSGGYRSYESCTTKHQTVLERDIQIPATGAGTERILPKLPGEYVIRVQTKDAHGAAVSSSSYVWVLGKGEAFWSGEEDARMSLIASKPRYKAGETARLVARTSMKNPTALVTLERSGVLSARVVTLEDSSQGFQIPITADLAPNVFASVAMVTGRTGEGDRKRPRFKMGVVDLRVSSEENRLAVALATDRPSYQPGETVSGSVRLSHGGKPVVGEVALSVADEGVLQLIAYKTPDPMAVFFASWGLGIDSGTNWNRIARLNDPMGEEDSEQGGDSGSGESGRIRSRFVSSAFWAPHLVTDESGEARFSFTAPDNLTAFRLMAVAADDGTRFGSGEMRITIKKPLLARPVLPRFAGAGDTIEVGVVIHNYSGADGTATVTAKATGVALDRAHETVKVASNGTARVRFTGRVAERGEGRFEFAVAMGPHRDALAVSVPIERGIHHEVKTLARGAVGGDGAPASIDVPVAWDRAALAGESELTVTVDRTGLADLEPSLRYLIEYPYGCLEQTLSRFIPLAKAKDLARSLDIDGLEGGKMEAFLRAGAAKVVRHQHADGNFSLWPSGETYPHLTVFALYGLNEAKRAGVKVDARAVKDGLDAMTRWAVDPKRVLGASAESGTLAMAAYLMAELGKPDPGLDARLFEARRGLPRYGQAFLLMALARAKADPAQVATLQGELVAQLEGQGDAVIVKETVDLHEVMGSDVRSTAIVTSALLMVAPDHPAIEKLVAGLEKAQLPSGRWYNTEDNLYGLVALADYARSRAKGSAQVTVKLAGKVLATRSVKGGKPLVLRRTLGKIEPGALTIASEGRALYTARVDEAHVERAAAAIDKGMAITREYLDPDSGRPLASFKANQLVRIRLTVKTPAERHYVAVRDRLPAGLEPVNSRLATEKHDAAPEDQGEDRWEPPKWVHVDLRDEGALVFADHLDAGEHVFEYNARATLPGEFALLPAEVEAMYDPDVRGRTASATMKVGR
ncbi:MAG TPA: MG2 domain-containing protein [Kofleriaceae bacterium]|nr:MG2 domain-containing protein [Kofleriaceae bacterium]